MTTETGNPTELCLRLRKRKDKTHIYIHESVMNSGCYLYATRPNDGATWPYIGPNFSRVRLRFCEKRAPGYYATKGDVARAWHNHRGER